jgi:hypothetical protein
MKKTNLAQAGPRPGNGTGEPVKLRAAAQRQLCSAWELDSTPFAWDNRWGMPLEAAAAGAFSGDDVLRPPNATIFAQARRWYRLHSFLRNVVNLKMGLHNHGLLGLRRLPVNPKKPNGETVVEWHPGIRAVADKDVERVKKWKEKNAEEISRVVQDVWLSFLLLRNVVALWMNGGRLMITPPENCKFMDKFGVERLTIQHNLSDEEIESLPGVSKKQKAALKTSRKLVITHDDEFFFFKVLKEEAVGMGFGWPDIATIFHACALNESLLVGDRQLADACRTVYEQHSLGHEIKSGLHAGSPVHFMSEIRAKAVEGQVKSKKGHIQMVTNFDHLIQIGAGRPKPEQYDTKRFAQVAEQLADWGMPYGQMLTGVINPYLMNLARSLAILDQHRMQPYLSALMLDGLGAPAPVMMVWDHSCFWDARMLLDMIKSGLQSGPVSGETFLRTAGFHPDDEREAKARDAALPTDLTLPVFDPNHGGQPGQGGLASQGKAGPGKTAGRQDKS